MSLDVGVWGLGVGVGSYATAAGALKGAQLPLHSPTFSAYLDTWASFALLGVKLRIQEPRLSHNLISLKGRYIVDSIRDCYKG